MSSVSRDLFECNTGCFSEYEAALMRLALMIRGMGNPLVATYARCYLCRVRCVNNKLILTLQMVIYCI